MGPLLAPWSPVVVVFSFFFLVCHILHNAKTKKNKEVYFDGNVSRKLPPSSRLSVSIEPLNFPKIPRTLITVFALSI